MLIFKGFSLILIRRKSNQGWYTYDVLENCPIFETPRPPIPLVHLRPTFSHSLKLWRPVSNNQTTLPLLQMITRQLKESIIQGWLLYVIRSFLQVGFPFQYQLINLVWLSFGWCLTTCFFVASYVVQKYYEMSFIYKHSHFQYWFCNQTALFAQTGNVKKLWDNNHTVQVNERNQNKNKTKPYHIQINHAFYCSFCPTKMQWYH